jgi:hypothetical protein
MRGESNKVYILSLCPNLSYTSLGFFPTFNILALTVSLSQHEKIEKSALAD